MKQKFLLSTLSCIMCVMFLFPINVMASGNSTYAWPGRPGGNGDASEEWLQGEYGETNGPYVLICKTEGMVSELGVDSKVEAIASAIIGAGVNKIDPRFGKVVTCVGLVAALTAPEYEGAYYRMYTYVSGRSMRVTTSTYKNSDYTGYVATYVEYVEW